VPELLTIRGPFRGYSGHDRTVRSFVAALMRAGIDLELIDVPHWSPAKLPPSMVDPSLEALTRSLPSRTAVQFCMPHQVTPLQGRRTVNFTMFEADRVPSLWVCHNRRHDLVVVPTDAARAAWLASGFAEDRIRLCSLGVDTESFRPGHQPLPLDDGQGRDVAGYRVRVLNVSEIVPRKNLLGLLRVWIEATSPHDDAILLLKLNHGRESLLRFLRDLHLLEQALGRSRAEAAPIRFFDHALSEDDMPRLFAAATHYWSMSCGEGWDQPMTEAGASGLRLIAPDHTAYRTYLTPEVATLLPCRNEAVDVAEVFEQRTLFEGARWWRPDEAAAAQAVRRAIEGRDTLAASARQRLEDEFGWDRAARRLIEIVDDLKAGEPPVRAPPLEGSAGAAPVRRSSVRVRPGG
jgi:glycosyltransferase involved in cell wall biosynthesis